MLRLKNIYLVCPLQKKTTQPITFVTVNLIQQIFLSGFIHPSVYLDPTKILVTYLCIIVYYISIAPWTFYKWCQQRIHPGIIFPLYVFSNIEMLIYAESSQLKTLYILFSTQLKQLCLPAIFFLKHIDQNLAQSHSKFQKVSIRPSETTPVHPWVLDLPILGPINPLLYLFLS